MMDADEFILTTVEPSVMSATDEETPDELLVFNISRPLGRNDGFFVNVKDHTRPITSFLQEDLVNLNIAYMPPPVSFSQRKVGYPSSHLSTLHHISFCSSCLWPRG